jgi:hypothetical protein
MRGVKSAIARTEATMIQVEAMLAATLPHLATKAELAEKPGKLYMWASWPFCSWPMRVDSPALPS